MRRHLADYYGTISHLDHEFGRVIMAQERGWDENTVVIFTSDQGWRSAAGTVDGEAKPV
jgi:arylsulfatase A-like enzyme